MLCQKPGRPRPGQDPGRSSLVYQTPNPKKPKLAARDKLWGVSKSRSLRPWLRMCPSHRCSRSRAYPATHAGKKIFSTSFTTTAGIATMATGTYASAAIGEAKVASTGSGLDMEASRSGRGSASSSLRSQSHTSYWRAGSPDQKRLSRPQPKTSKFGRQTIPMRDYRVEHFVRYVRRGQTIATGGVTRAMKATGAFATTVLTKEGHARMPCCLWPTRPPCSKPCHRHRAHAPPRIRRHPQWWSGSTPTPLGRSRCSPLSPPATCAKRPLRLPRAASTASAA